MMNQPELYRGLWPQNVSRLAKYGVRFIDRVWRISVLYEADEGLRFLAVDNAVGDLAERINAVKQAVGDGPGGAFYVNEYRHVIVPIRDSTSGVAGSAYYSAGRLDVDLTFEFEGAPLSTRPVRPDGTLLQPGESWVGPRPGVPYVLSAGGGDVYYETPALTDDDPPRLRPGMTRKVSLSKVLADKDAVAHAVQPVAAIRGHAGGRFYVNEHSAIFSPIDKGDGNGLDYIFCGTIDKTAWFPEPRLAPIG